jgi:hypothetical protein
MSKISQINEFVECLLDKLESLNITEKTNLILASAAFRFREIVISEYVNPDHINWTSSALGIKNGDKGLL